MKKYLIVGFFAFIGVSCQTVKKVESESYEINYQDLSLDTTRLKIFECFTFDSGLLRTIDGEKKVAVSVEITDSTLLNAITLKEGRIDNRNLDYFILVNKDGEIIHNQNYAWKTLSDTITGLFLDVIPDSTSELNLFEYKWNSSDVKLNKQPIRIRNGSLPFREEGLYKSLQNHENIRGYFEEDLDDSSFLIKSFDKTGNKASLLQINIGGKIIEVDSLKYKSFSSFAKNDKTWSAKTYLPPDKDWSWETDEKGLSVRKYGKTRGKDYLIFGSISNLGDLNKSIQTEFRGGSITESFYFGDKLFHVNKYNKMCKIENDSLEIDSSFISLAKSIDDYTLLPETDLRPIEYAKTKHGVRYGNAILSFVNNKWKIIHRIDSLANWYNSSAATNHDGFYFVANRKAYFSNYEFTKEILLEYENIMSVNKGPEDYLIFKLGSGKDEVLGLIYNTKTKNEYPINPYKISRNMDFHARLIKYRKSKNSILLLTDFGLHEIAFDELIKD